MEDVYGEWIMAKKPLQCRIDLVSQIRCTNLGTHTVRTTGGKVFNVCRKHFDAHAATIQGIESGERREIESAILREADLSMDWPEIRPDPAGGEVCP